MQQARELSYAQLLSAIPSFNPAQSQEESSSLSDRLRCARIGLVLNDLGVSVPTDIETSHSELLRLLARASAEKNSVAARRQNGRKGGAPRKWDDAFLEGMHIHLTRSVPKGGEAAELRRLYRGDIEAEEAELPPEKRRSGIMKARLAARRAKRFAKSLYRYRKRRGGDIASAILAAMNRYAKKSSDIT